MDLSERENKVLDFLRRKRGETASEDELQKLLFPPRDDWDGLRGKELLRRTNIMVLENELFHSTMDVMAGERLIRHPSRRRSDSYRWTLGPAAQGI